MSAILLLCNAGIAPALALPFKPTCQSMAGFVQGVFSQDREKIEKYSFKGYRGGIQFSSELGQYYCDGGYVTEVSPRGKMVCLSYIAYDESSGTAFWGAGPYFAKVLSLMRLKRTNSTLKEVGVARDILQNFEAYQNELDEIKLSRMPGAINPCTIR